MESLHGDLSIQEFGQGVTRITTEVRQARNLLQQEVIRSVRKKVRSNIAL